MPGQTTPGGIVRAMRVALRNTSGRSETLAHRGTPSVPAVIDGKHNRRALLTTALDGFVALDVTAQLAHEGHNQCEIERCDVRMAGRAIFAIRGLARYLDAHVVPYAPFEDFHDIVRALKG